ncbi:ABC transporter substrate-binding protein [Oceanobacillus jeddahense]|uniref:ABC transporter substrate-binding protein n=1 Tax=Oceanobacillus jeddahense TaxID=1462527 RepID=A0ABY5JPX7_9BACI|nr:ABC transporter substrate-binding protein [Oceanobacillus jeddahense]UUI02357.1 ABC transporter substrate-binding protein [Oceanobacillus jeddahense]
MKKVIQSFSLLLVIFLFIAGCGNNGQDDSAEGAEGDSDTLVLAQASDIPSIDPQNSLSTTGDRVHRNLFSRLFIWDNDLDLQEDLVDTYEQVDEETWHFHLKEGVTFHNGDSLTAEDVKFSLERVMTDETLKEYPYFGQLDEVNALDDLTVEVVTDGPMPTLLNLLAKSGSDVLPKDYFEEVGVEEFQNNPIGSGPYKFVEWVKDDRVVLEANEDYFGEDPKWKNVEVRAITESSTRIGELLTGGVDIITDVPPNEWDRVDADPEASLINGDTTRVNLLMVRTTDEYVTSDPLVREAIDLAIDNQAIIDSVLQGNGISVRTRVPEGVFGSATELVDTQVHDVEKAKELLTEAGYPDGVDITFTASRGRYPLDSEIAQLIGSMLEEAGFNVNLELLESSAFLDKYNSNSNDELIMIGLADGLLDASYSLVHYTEERAEGQTDYQNDEVEELFNLAGRNLDEGEREEQYQRIQEIIAEERPHIFINQSVVSYGVSDYLNFEPRLDEVILFDNITLN